MNDIDFLLLKSQHEALRTYFCSLLKTIMNGDVDRVWLAKFLLWRIERENLAPLSCTTQLSSPEKARIHRRRFQLQVLMDVAYIRGHLEEFRIPYRISRHDAAQAERVFSQSSDGTEQTMLPLIDKLFD
jgi:hypothetical protein